MAAIRSAFVSYPKEGDPDWRSPNWIMPEECAHLTRVGSKGLSDREEATCHPVFEIDTGLQAEERALAYALAPELSQPRSGKGPVGPVLCKRFPSADENGVRLTSR